MNAVLSIAAREIRSQFLSPMAWTMLAVTAAILGYAFLIQLERFVELQARLQDLVEAPGATELVVLPLMKTAAFVFLMTMPLLTMNSIAEERRQKTLVLLLAAPVTSVQIVLGKFFGLAAYIVALLALSAALPAMLMLGGTLDVGLLAVALLGLALLLAATAAVGVCVSAHAPAPAIAAFGSFGLLLGMWMLNWTADSGSASLIAYLSLGEHFDHFLTGVVRLQDVAYFVLLCVGFLTLSALRLQREPSKS